MRIESYHVEDDCTLVLTYGLSDVKVNLKIPNRTLKEALDLMENTPLSIAEVEIIIV